MQEEEKVLLHRDSDNVQVCFKVYSQKGAQYKITFQANTLLFKCKDDQIELAFKDMIGVKTQKIDQRVTKIIIHSFPVQKRLFRKEERILDSFHFYAQASAEAIGSFQHALCKKITNRTFERSKHLKFIAYFNPAAGSNSKAHLMRVQKFISLTNFQLEVVTTEYKHFCKEHLSTVDLTQYSGILIISGDGLMHEFVNSSACGKLPVCHVPAGSANAFAKTQTSSAHQQCTTETAVFLAVKGRAKPFNVWKIQLEKEIQPVYSFLSVEWAFMADIDINSQFLRCFGGLRFQIYSVWRCIALRRYPAKIAYCYQDKLLPTLNEPITDEAFQTIQNEFLSAIFTTIPFISDKYEFAPLLQPEDKAIDMQLLTTNHGRWNLVKYLLNSQTGAHFDRQKNDLKEGAGLGWGKIKSYRIEPTGEGVLLGLYGIDGEHYESQKLQASRSDRQLLAFV